MTKRLNDTREAAVLLMGGAGALCRNYRYIERVIEHGLTPVLISPQTFRDQYEPLLSDPAHLFSKLGEALWIEGSMSSESSFNASAVQAVKELSSRYTIISAIPTGEVLLEPAGIIAEALNVPGVGSKAARIARSKYLQRLYLDRMSPMWEIVDRTSGSKFGEQLQYPCVLKPAGRHSSSGVHRVNNSSEAVEKLKDYPATETILLEQEAKGPEYSVETFVLKGEITFSSVTEKETNEHIGEYVETRHVIPARSTNALDRLHTANRNLIQIVAVQTGIVHSEFRISGQDAILMEYTVRTPGDAASLMYKIAGDKYIEDLVVDSLVLGEPAQMTLDGVASQIFLDQEQGTYQGVLWRDARFDGLHTYDVSDGKVWPKLDSWIELDTPHGVGRVWGIFQCVPKGAEIRSTADSSDRAAFLIISGPLHSITDWITSEIRKKLFIRVDLAESKTEV